MDDVAVTHLWVYKEKDFLDGDPNVNQTLIYSEILEGNQVTNTQKIIPIEKHVTEIEGKFFFSSFGSTGRS